MSARTLWSALVASAVVLATGTGITAGGTTTNNQLVDFNQQTGELWGYPTGQPLATYLHGPQTVHLQADLTRFAPPDPCRVFAQIWNDTIKFDDKHGVESTQVFNVLLTLQSDFQCSASINSDNGVPQPIVYITPIAN